MSDYIKREDAKRAIRRNFHDLETRLMINNILNEVAKVSSCNLIEVVRCKDCRHFRDRKLKLLDDIYECDLTGLVTKPDNYCNYGEGV